MKALIVYGTRYGTATEIAEEIGRVIKNEGIEVDVKDARSLKNIDLSLYQLVVVGSGIKMGKWTKKSLKFLQENKEALATRKVAIFVTCGAANEEKNRAEGQEKYLDQVAEKNLINEPVATGLFGSKFDPHAKHGLMYKFTMNFIKKDLEKQGIDTSQPIDYRDWDEIRAWARGLADMIKE
ncbi:nitric oxide synthase [Methanobacterium sp. CWC-01]|uniref:flavodoxin domain-containing protein n=1 Tax=Methanobacterium aridiramus TaxID=2584467 RepID=UPI0025780AE7|nr:flavodoxin domain-containing protein [Methanobacterium sp. CWC-01]WJI09274.1 nitric oxide synthase [Methanobacterium sp. CWC-01]